MSRGGVLEENKGNIGYRSGWPVRSYSWERGNQVASFGRGKGEPVEAMKSLIKTQGINRYRGATFRKLLDEEMQDKIRKGLSFRCDEKFGPNHLCRNKQLHMLTIEEDLSSYDELVTCKGDRKEYVKKDKA